MYLPYEYMQAEQLNQQGIRYYANGRPDLARQAFEQAVALAPDFAGARVSLARIKLEAYELLEAEEQLQIALSLPAEPPTQQAALVNLASVRYAQKAFYESIALLKQASHVLMPDNEICSNLGLCYAEIGQWEEAEKHLRLSLEMYPTPRAQTGLERLEIRSRSSAEADALRSSLYQSGRNSVTLHECGNGHLSAGAEQEINKLLAGTNKIAFFAGAGISVPVPSSLPVAGKILSEIFRFFTDLDRQLLTDHGIPLLTQEQVAQELCHSDSLPFEISFQALQDVLGLPVLTFVDLLKSGKPNLHHKMLAQALKQGHTVITTNFDDKIEQAYHDLFGSSDGLHRLVTDKEFQLANDRGLQAGVLAKIHGDLYDYNSLALTIEGLAIRADKTLRLADIGEEKGLREIQLAFPQTLLSIPKTLFLQRMIREKLMVFIGYSGSDAYDIMPILHSSEFAGPGIWVQHQGPDSPAIENWKVRSSERIVLHSSEAIEPETESGPKPASDITSAVSRHLLQYFKAADQRDAKSGWFNKLIGALRTKPAEDFGGPFSQWLDRLRVHPGDGAYWLGKLYSRHTNWNKAAQYYQVASLAYDQQGNDLRYLSAKMDFAVMLKNMGEGKDKDNEENNERAHKLYRDIKFFIENSKNPSLYAHLHARVLLNLAIEVDTEEEAMHLYRKAMRIASEINDLSSMCIGYRIAAERQFRQERYEQALDLYLRALQLASDILGDMIEACITSAQGGMCLVKLGKYPQAGELLARSEMYARNLGDRALLSLVDQGLARLAQATSQASATSTGFHEKLIADAKSQLAASGSEESKVDEILEMIRFQRYEVALNKIDRLMSKYDFEKVQAFSRFVRSNIHHRTCEWGKEIEWLQKFQELGPDFQNIPQILLNLAVAHHESAEHQKSEQFFLKAIEQVGGIYPLAHCNLGLLYADMGDLEKAKIQLEKAEQSNAPEFSLQALRKRFENKIESQKK